MANEVWQEIYDRLAELIEAHRTTLIFVNTRRLAERAARFLSERLSEEQVAAHHGSLAREHRLEAEQRLKSGRLKALIATASLELGIDIGEVDLVCQLGSPRSIAAFLQRVGRSGHAVNAIPKGRLFPLSRDELIECAALLDAIRHDELDRIRIPAQPLDVLAQQIVAEVASREWNEAELYRRLRRAWPYRDLNRETFTEVVRMLADGFATRRGRRGAWLHRDAVHGQLRARRGARLTALLNGGAIPDQFDYDVILSPEGLFRRHPERGLRLREPARRHLPAGQHLLPHPEDPAGQGLCGGRQGSAPEHPVLVRRGARPQRRAVAGGVAPARAHRTATGARPGGRQRLADQRIRPA